MKICCRMGFHFLWMTLCYFLTSTLVFAAESTLIAQDNRPILTVQSGHAGGIRCSAISSDGTLGLTGGYDRLVWLWDLKTCKGLHRFLLPEVPSALAFCENDNQMLTTGAGNLVQLWDMASEKLIRSFSGHSDRITVIRVSADGRYLLTGSIDKTARLWDVAKGTQLQKYQCQANVHCVDISADGKSAIVASDDRIISIRDTESGREIHRFAGHDGRICCLRFSPDSKRILSGGEDKVAILWDTVTGKELCKCEGHNERICGVGFSSDGDHLLTASDDKSIRIWDETTGKETKSPIKRFGPPESVVLVNQRTNKAGPGSKVSWTVVFSADGKTALATSNNFATLRVWNIDNGRPVGELKGMTTKPQLVGFFHEGQQLRLERGVWDLTTGDQIEGDAWGAEKGKYVATSPDGKWAITSHGDKSLRLWDFATGNETRRIKKELPNDNLAALLPGGEKLFAAGRILMLVVDMHTGKDINLFQGSTDKINLDITCLAASPDGRHAATGGKDYIVRLWDLTVGKEIKNFKGHNGWISSLIFSPDGKQILSGSGDATIRLWDIASGKEISQLRGHTNVVTCLVFSTDGSQILSGSMDDTARLWQVKPSKLLHLLKGHVSSVASVCFSPDSRRLFTAGDRTVVVWDAVNGQELCQLVSFQKKGGWAVIDSDGRYDASNGGEAEGLHWIVGNERIDLSQLKSRYYEPGLLAKIMGFNKEPLRDVKEFTAPKLYPLVELAAPTIEHPVLAIRLTDRGGGIGRVVVKINDKELTADARGANATSVSGRMELQVDLENDRRLNVGEQNVIEVSAFNAEGYLQSRGQQVFYTPSGQKAQNKMNMWAIIVGVSKYANGTLKLHYAAKDAEDFAKALNVAGGRLFGKDNVHVALLTTNAQGEYLPTRANLSREFEFVAKNAKSGDILVVYLAGHGVNYGGSDGDFYYLTCDATNSELKDPEIRRQCAISSDELTEWIKNIRTTDKQVIILDTCAAAKLGEKFAEKRDVPSSQIRSLQRVKDRTGIHVLSGCAADAVSYETSRYGQGLLTYSLLFGMRGAALRENQYVDVLRLFSFAQDQVPQLALGIGGIQKPVIFSPEGASFDIGWLITESEKAEIPLQAVRPLVMRSNFQEEEGYKDTLSLAQQVDQELRDVSVRGSKTSPVFIDTEGFPDAFQLLGRYRIDSKKLIININLFKGGKKVAAFSINGDISDLNVVAKKIVEETQRQLATLGKTVAKPPNESP